MSKLHRMFVYGTLKMGFPNHYLVTNQKNGSANFVGEAETLGKWPLVVGTPYNIPFVLDKPGFGNRIQGEMYDVDDEMLATLDKLENHPHWYERRKIIVQPFDDTEQDQIAWCYILHNFKEELLNQNMMSSYGEEECKYVAHVERASGEDLCAMVKKVEQQ